MRSAISKLALGAALLAGLGCASTLPIAGDWVGGVRRHGAWHPARVRLTQVRTMVSGVADVPSLGIEGAAVEGTITGSNLRLRMDLPPAGAMEFSAVREPNRLHTDHRSVTGPALQLVRPLAGPDALAEYPGWYTDDRGTTVVVVPGSEGGLRFFGLGRLSGTLLPEDGNDRFHVGWFDQAPTPLHTAACFVRDAAGRVARFELGENPRRHGTSLRRVEPSPYAQERIEFQSGEVLLRGTLFAPADGRAHPAVVFVHGTGFQTADRSYEMSLLEAFLSRGIAVLLYDKRGCGGSGGDWRDASLEDLARDAAAAVTALRQRPWVDPRRIGAYGISEGGWIAPIVARLDPELAFVVNQGGPAVSPLEDELDDLTTGVARLGLAPADHAAAMRLVRAWVDLYRSSEALPHYVAVLDTVRGQKWFEPFASRLPTTDADWEVQWWRQRGQLDPEPLWADQRVPALVLIGERDETMDVAKNLARFREFQRARPELELRVVPRADHALRVEGRRAEGFPDGVAAWISQVVR